MKTIKSRDIGKDFFGFRDAGETAAVREIISGVRERRDDAVREYTLKHDGARIGGFLVERRVISKARREISGELVESILHAKKNIERFAKRQLRQLRDFDFETEKGVLAGQKVAPLERIAVYVPGGRYPLVSSLLMCAIPAKIAGVREIAVFSPPAVKGNPHPAILAACDILGLKEVYRVGGAQAVAAAAFGTESIRGVDKIVGPGNRYVAAAKKEVSGAVGTDFIAGPSEVMIIADDSSNPAWIAADLLAQAEHDADAVPVLVTCSMKVAKETSKAVAAFLETLPTRGTAAASIERNGLIIIAKNHEEAISIANRKAPEHLELHVKDPEYYEKRLRNYGTLFIGKYSAEVFGDYTSGVNHTLPTNLAARYTGGLSVKDFLKFQTTLRVNKRGAVKMAPHAIRLAETEGLSAHALSADIRKK